MDKKTYFNREGREMFFDNADAVSVYCQDKCREEVEHILRVADEVCKREFLFDLRWDMERTWQPEYYEDPIDWERIPAGDTEFVWQFNRHRFFICLGQAYVLTQDEKYTRAFIELLTDWIHRMKPEGESRYLSWRTLETGLRGVYWTKAMEYFRESPLIDDNIIGIFVHSLAEQAEYLLENHSDYKYISNWGMMENHGLFQIGVFLKGYGNSEAYVKTALEHLEQAVQIQIMRDGSHWEQSPMYHNEVMQSLMDVVVLGRRNQIEIPDKIYESAYKMVCADLVWQKPDGHQFMNGDSDDTDIRDLMTQAAWIFAEPLFKFAGYSEFDYESAWNLGAKAAKEYAQMSGREPEYTSAGLNDSGNYYLRSGWGETQNLLHFHDGTLGAGHGHSDKLHIDLVMDGRDILVDAGRYTYDVALGRFDFKNPDAHNTLLVDGAYFTVCKTTWECSKMAQPVNCHFHTSQNYDYAEGGHLGYIDKGIFVNRRIVYIKPDIYLIADEVYAEGEHTADQYFHFSEQGSVEVQGNIAKYKDKVGEVWMHIPGDGYEISKIESKVARDYNKKAANDALKISQRQQGFQAMYAVVTRPGYTISKLDVRSTLKGVIYEKEKAEAIKVITAEQKEYVVIICHTEVNSPTDMVESCGYKGFGNVIVFEQEKGSLGGYVLKW